MWSLIERALRAWLTWWFDAPDAVHQFQFYRCEACRRIVTWRRIRQGGCVCSFNKMRPALLTVRDKARLLLLPWSVAR